MGITRKRCSKCNFVKSLIEFYRNKRSKDKHSSHCKSCVKSTYALNPDEENTITKRNRKIRKIAAMKRGLHHNYGISLEKYYEMENKQGGVCAICEKRPTNKKVRLSVDHDHETGEIRALLCNRCNLGLGHFRDDIELVSKALKYIKKFKKITI